jgi:hypothetical protein
VAAFCFEEEKIFRTSKGKDKGQRIKDKGQRIKDKG